MPGESRLLDAPPHHVSSDETIQIGKQYEFLVLFTSTPGWTGDQKLAFETFKKGDLDYYYVNVSREWVEELNFDKIQRGVIQKRKIFTDNPVGACDNASMPVSAVMRTQS